MALVVTATLTNTTVSPNETAGVSGLSITPAGTHEQSGRVSIGTSEETIAVHADIGTTGYLLVINRNDTQFVQLGYATGVYFASLKAGYPLLLPLDNSVSTLYLKADTAPCQVEYKLFESA